MQGQQRQITTTGLNTVRVILVNTSLQGTRVFSDGNNAEITAGGFNEISQIDYGGWLLSLTSFLLQIEVHARKMDRAR